MKPPASRDAAGGLTAAAAAVRAVQPSGGSICRQRSMPLIRWQALVKTRQCTMFAASFRLLASCRWRFSSASLAACAPVWSPSFSVARSSRNLQRDRRAGPQPTILKTDFHARPGMSRRRHFFRYSGCVQMAQCSKMQRQIQLVPLSSSDAMPACIMHGIVHGSMHGASIHQYQRRCKPA